MTYADPLPLITTATNGDGPKTKDQRLMTDRLFQVAINGAFTDAEQLCCRQSMTIALLKRL